MSEQSFENVDDQSTSTASTEDTGAANADASEEHSFEYNGKSMSSEDAKKKMENADQHIQTLESEREQDRKRVEALVEEVEKLKGSKATMEELMERMGTNANADETNTGDPKSVDYDKIAERAADQAFARLTQVEQEKVYKANLSDVSVKLKEKFGDKTDETVFSQMEDLGYTRQEAFDLAGKRPKAFLRMIGYEDSPKNTSPAPTSGDRVNPRGSSVPNLEDTGKLIGQKNTKSRVNAWEARIAAKLNQLGINT